MSDVEIFGATDASKVRQLIGGLSLLLTEFQEYLHPILDADSFTLLYQNEDVLEEISKWFTYPGAELNQGDNNAISAVITSLKILLKRIIARNSSNGVILKKSSSDGLKILIKERKV